MNWEQYKHEFDCDGSLRDIYILNTSLNEWQQLVDWLHSGAYDFSYSVNGEPQPLPSSVGTIFPNRDVGKLLLIDVASIGMACHFFFEAEIEFDINPCEIKSDVQAESIFDFMQKIGDLLSKEVVLTPENLPSEPIFKFCPMSGEIRYIYRRL